MIRSLVLAGITLSLAGVIAGDSQPDTSVQNLFVLNGQRVLVIKLHIHIDGKTPQQRFAEWGRSAFDLADTNRDGFLVADELTVELTGKLGLDGDPWSLDDSPCDQHLSFAELQRWLAANANGVRLQTNFQTPTTTDQPLMRELDEDQDGSLTEDEIEDVFERLRKQDVDDSETISLNELTPGARIIASDLTSRCEFVLVPEGTVSQRLLSLLARRAKAGKVKGRDLRLYGSSSRLGSVDFDGDKKLDRLELIEFTRHPQPDIELQIHIDTAVGSLSVTTLKNLTNRVESRTDRGWSRIVIGQDVEIGLVARSAIDPLKAALAVFTARDRDRNGYLDEAERRSFPLPQVSSFDSDADGNVFQSEFKVGVQRLIDQVSAQTDFAIDRWGRSLFSAIDSDRNLQLSRREFASLANRIKAWDANADGALTSSEIPESYQLKIGPGLPRFVAGRSAGQNQLGQPQSGLPQPIWMRQLDRNGDGDLSRREFPGSNDAFNKLDKNRDGFVDLREALQATSVERKEDKK